MRFNILMLDRDDADLYRQIKRIMKKNGQWREYLAEASHLEDRLELKARIEESTDAAGNVYVGESGRDCDCVQYCHGRVRQAPTVIEFERLRDHTYEWADGPCAVWVCHPDEAPESFSRDLIMEAYEDGHPHAIYA